MNRTSARLTQGRARVHRVERGARDVAHRQQGWLIPLGRVGYAANGIVYVIVGVLAAEAAQGTGGDMTGTGGALGHIVDAPFGRVLLTLVAIGLLGYAIWRLLQALLDTERKGEEPKGLADRAGFLVSAGVYASLALSAAGMALGKSGAPDQEGQTQDRTAWVMSQPFGPWLVGVAGVVVIGMGVAQLLHAYRGSFADKLLENEMSSNERQLVNVAGRVGHTARGVVFGLVGLFLVIAGVQSQPDQARGLGGALTVLASEPFGPWLLGFVALGLVAYGVYMLIAARYRRMVLT